MTFQISRLNNIYDITPKPYPLDVVALEMRKGNTTLHDLHADATARTLADATTYAQTLRKKHGQAPYDQMKKDMPQFMPALITKTRYAHDSEVFSGLVCLEYDDDEIDTAYAFVLASQNPHVVLAWRSLSGKPKMLIAIEKQSIDGDPLNASTFEHAWITAAQMFEEIGEADTGAMRPTQPQNLCHDPNLYINHDTIPLPWDVDFDALSEVKTAARKHRKPTGTGNISKLDPQYLQAIEEFDFDDRGIAKKMVPCPFTFHEHDDWDTSAATNATRIIQHKNGDVTLRCYKCSQSKRFYAESDIPNTEVTPEIIAQAPSLIEVRQTASFRYFTPEEKTVIREVLQKDPDAGWIEDTPAWITKYEKLHRLTGEFARNGQPPEVENRRMWHSQFTQCDKCGGITAKWIDRYLLTSGKYCNDCHKDYPLGSYLEYELCRKLPNSIISDSDAAYLGEDPEFADFRLWEPGTLTYLGAAMGTGKSTEIYSEMARLTQQGIGNQGIIAVPRISLARFLAHYLRSRDGFRAWGLWHEGVPSGNKFIGHAGAICCVPSLPAVLAEAEGAKVYIAIDEIDFAYNLLSLTITQATRVKQILRRALQETGLVVAGQTESTLALEAFAEEIEAKQVQGFYKNAPPSDSVVTAYKYPDVDGKNNLVMAGAEVAIVNALEDGKNVYTFCTSRRDAEILEHHFLDEAPVLYDAYTKGTQHADAVLKNQRLTNSRLFIATSAAGIGISVSDEQAHTVQVSSLLFGSRNCNNIAQQAVRDRRRCGGSLHYTDYAFRLPVKPSTNTRVSLYHEALKAAEDSSVFLPEHAVRKIAAADALSTLADTQPDTFLKYHLGEVAQMPLAFEDGDIANQTQTERIKVTRSTLRKEERDEKQQAARALLKSKTVMTSTQIRRQSNAGQLQKSERLAQELANIALQAAGWQQEETPNAAVIDIAKALIEACVPIENLEKQRRGFYAVQFPHWTAAQLDKERLLAYREVVSQGTGVELTAITDDRFMGQLLSTLLGKLAGVTWTEASFADAVWEVLNSTVTDHEGCKGSSFLANLLSGAAGPRLYRSSRFLKLTDDAGVCRWASQLIREWYPARIGKRGKAYGLQRHEHYDLILQCFKSWGTQLISKEPDRWHIDEYATVELPDPNAESIEKARKMRKNGKDLLDIAKATGFNISTVSRWCIGINPKAQQQLQARELETQGLKRKEIAAKLGVHISTLRRWLGKKRA